MHEGIIANKIIEKAKEHGNVRKITVEVGDLAHLPALEMKEALSKRVNWEIIITTKKAKVKCKCGFEGEPRIIEHAHDVAIYECPECKKIPSEILCGDEIILKEVEVD
ncbi:hydrogenase maturation nickel metallochaperone HypA [Candidatus Woesearchaeota archaeon]|nr:hydrogenase maturation nickel metallochaperone HypA [Candidatus Woesearchaeota archaeon]